MVVLAVDDKPINNKVIELDVEEYCEDRGIDFEFHQVDSGAKALEFLKSWEVDIVFMDLMMPKMSGDEVTVKIREMENIVQPSIVMVTALNTPESVQKAKESWCDYFIAKPYCDKEIHNVLDMIVAQNKDEFIVPATIVEEEDELFIDFDDDFGDQFLDFDDEDSAIEDQKQMMANFNSSHKMVHANEFLALYPDIFDAVDDLEFLEGDVYNHIDHLDAENLSDEILSVLDVLSHYASFFIKFVEFQELSTAIELLMRVLNNTPVYGFDEKTRRFVADYLVAILNDLVVWKNHVFINQDAVDVFYINASLLNSCIQLEALLKKGKL